MPDSITPPRYAIAIDGRNRDDLIASMTALALHESLDEPARLEVTVIDAPGPGDGPPRLRFADDATLDVGGALELTLAVDADRTLLFIGNLTEVAPTYPAADVPTCTIRAVARSRRPPAAAIGAVAPATPRLVLHAGLIEAALARGERGLVTGAASADGPPALRPGRSVELVGLGDRFSGTYAVTAATHRFGPDGHRTSFVVRRDAGP